MSGAWHEWPDDVKAVALKAAADVARKFPSGLEIEDLEQEGLIYIATHAETIQRRLTQEGGGLAYAGWRVYSYLRDLSEPLARKVNASTEFEAWAEPHR